MGLILLLFSLLDLYIVLVVMAFELLDNVGAFDETLDDDDSLDEALEADDDLDEALYSSDLLDCLEFLRFWTPLDLLEVIVVACSISSIAF